MQDKTDNKTIDLEDFIKTMPGKNPDIDFIGDYNVEPPPWLEDPPPPGDEDAPEGLDEEPARPSPPPSPLPPEEIDDDIPF